MGPRCAPFLLQAAHLRAGSRGTETQEEEGEEGGWAGRDTETQEEDGEEGG